MFLTKIHLNLHCKEVRRDLSDPYQLHSTLCRAFSDSQKKCPANEFLWRLEPETNPLGYPRVIIQSRSAPKWDKLGIKEWLFDSAPPIDINRKLSLDKLAKGKIFRFRLRANPSVTRGGKRFGLFKQDEQSGWMKRQSQRGGFSILEDTLRISQEQMIRAKQHEGNRITIYSVLFDGCAEITAPDVFKDTIEKGIGHGKALGLGLISAVPISLGA